MFEGVPAAIICDTSTVVWLASDVSRQDCRTSGERMEILDLWDIYGLNRTAKVAPWH